MIGSILGILSSVLGMVSSATANNRSKSAIDRLASQQRIPRAVLAAESIYRQDAASDMPGMQNRLSDIESGQVKTINQAKDYVSGGGLLAALSDIYTKGNEAKEKVYDTNEAYRVEARNRLAQFLGNQGAYYESKRSDDLNSLALSKIGIDEAGTQDKLNFTNSALNAVSNDRGLLAMINSILEKNGDGGGTTNVLGFLKNSPDAQTVPGSENYMTDFGVDRMSSLSAVDKLLNRHEVPGLRGTGYYKYY